MDGVFLWDIRSLTWSARRCYGDSVDQTVCRHQRPIFVIVIEIRKPGGEDVVNLKSDVPAMSLAEPRFSCEAAAEATDGAFSPKGVQGPPGSIH